MYFKIIDQTIANTTFTEDASLRNDLEDAGDMTSTPVLPESMQFSQLTMPSTEMVIICILRPWPLAVFVQADIDSEIIIAILSSSIKGNS